MAEERIQELPFPPDLDGRMNAVLNSVNLEPKSVTLLHMDDQFVEPRELKELLPDSLGEDAPFSMEVRTFTGYCEASLYPIGLMLKRMALEGAGGEVVMKYALSKAGERYGHAVASLAIRYSIENNRSLIGILSTSNTSAVVRAPLVRVKILKAISDMSEPVNVTEVATRLGLTKSVVGKAAKELHRAGMLHRDSESKLNGGDYVFYRISENEPEAFECMQGAQRLTGVIAQLMKDKGRKYIPIKTIQEYVISMTGREYKKHTIGCILSNLADQGVLEKEKWTGNYSTWVSPVDEGRRFVDSFVRPLEDALQYETDLAKLQDLHEEFVMSGGYRGILIRALRLYAGDPMRPERVSQEARMSMLYDLVFQHHGGIEKNRIADVIGWDRYLVKKCLDRMVREGMLFRDACESRVLYFPAEKI